MNTKNTTKTTDNDETWAWPFTTGAALFVAEDGWECSSIEELEEHYTNVFESFDEKDKQNQLFLPFTTSNAKKVPYKTFFLSACKYYFNFVEGLDGTRSVGQWRNTFYPIIFYSICGEEILETGKLQSFILDRKESYCPTPLSLSGYGVETTKITPEQKVEALEKSFQGFELFLYKNDIARQARGEIPFSLERDGTRFATVLSWFQLNQFMIEELLLECEKAQSVQPLIEFFDNFANTRGKNKGFLFRKILKYQIKSTLEFVELNDQVFSNEVVDRFYQNKLKSSQLVEAITKVFEEPENDNLFPVSQALRSYGLISSKNLCSTLQAIDFDDPPYLTREKVQQQGDFPVETLVERDFIKVKQRLRSKIGDESIQALSTILLLIAATIAAQCAPRPPVPPNLNRDGATARD